MTITAIHAELVELHLSDPPARLGPPEDPPPELVGRAWDAPMGCDPSPSTIRPFDEPLTQEVP